MAATLACANCGAEGEANFSANYFGELVCELCGTQSYLQNRTETQDAEDMGIDMATLGKMKQSKRKQKRARKIKTEHDETRQQPIKLLDCIVATQYILHEQAEALVRVGFPPEFPRVVRDVWFHLLRTWHRKGARPLLRCFTEFHYQRQAADKAMDPAVTNDVLEQWDAENGGDLERLFSQSQSTTTTAATTTTTKHGHRDPLDVGPTSVPGETKHKRTRHWVHTLDWFVLPDMVGVLVLAGRLLNVAALPCDYAHWITCGELPYYNLLSRCPLAMQEKLERVAVFFDATIRTNWISTAVIAYRAHYLQFHLEMRVPPLNASLIAFTICENLDFPPPVFRHFQWLSAQFNLAGELPEKPLQQKPVTRFQDAARGSALDSGAGIAAYLLAAIRLCPNWNEWIYEHARGPRDQHVAPYSTAEADKLPRRELGAFVDFCEDVLLGADRGRIPDEFTAHVHALKTDLSRNKAHYFSRTYQAHALRAYPPEYEDGVCVETTREIETRVERVKTHHGILSGVVDEKMELEDAARTVKPTLFYPLYAHTERVSFHTPFEAALELVSEYIDCPMGVVMKWVDVIDRGLRDRAREFRLQRPDKSEANDEAAQDEEDEDDVEDEDEVEGDEEVEKDHDYEKLQTMAAEFQQEENELQADAENESILAETQANEDPRSPADEDSKQEDLGDDPGDPGFEKLKAVVVESQQVEGETHEQAESQAVSVESRPARRRGRLRKVPRDQMDTGSRFS